MYVILYFEYNIFSYVCLFLDLSSNSFTWLWNKFVPCFTLICATVSTCRTNGMDVLEMKYVQGDQNPYQMQKPYINW